MAPCLTAPCKGLRIHALGRVLHRVLERVNRVRSELSLDVFTGPHVLVVLKGGRPTWEDRSWAVGRAEESVPRAQRGEGHRKLIALIAPVRPAEEAARLPCHQLCDAALTGAELVSLRCGATISCTHVGGALEVHTARKPRENLLHGTAFVIRSWRTIAALPREAVANAAFIKVAPPLRRGDQA
eukprot:scaffold10551_cov69-Phaeocystis_antarctica.AAC.2